MINQNRARAGKQNEVAQRSLAGPLRANVESMQPREGPTSDKRIPRPCPAADLIAEPNAKCLLLLGFAVAKQSESGFFVGLSQTFFRSLAAFGGPAAMRFGSFRVAFGLAFSGILLGADRFGFLFLGGSLVEIA